MAMSDAASSHADWTQLLYGRGILAPPPSHHPVASPVMVHPLPDSTAAVVPGAAAPQSGIEGRVSKPARRRPRASRRAPTTLLNTDTANFRAMVQQFTGIPSRPYSASPAYHPGGEPPPAPAIIDYGLNFGEPSLGQANPMPFQGYQQNYQQQYQPNGSGVGNSDAFLQGFGDHGSNNVDVGDCLFFGGFPNHQNDTKGYGVLH